MKFMLFAHSHSMTHHENLFAKALKWYIEETSHIYDQVDLTSKFDQRID